MKRILLVALALLLPACDSAKTNVRDPLTGDAIDSVKMEFKDTTVLLLWGVPYPRFSLELRVHTDSAGNKTTDVLATCNHIAPAPLNLTVDRREMILPGTLQDDKTERYSLTPEDLREMAYAKSIIVRVYHGDNGHEDADIGPDRIRQIRKLYEKNFPPAPRIVLKKVPWTSAPCSLSRKIPNRPN